MRRGVAAGAFAVAAVCIAAGVAVAAGGAPRFGAARVVANVATSGYLQEVGGADVTGDGHPDVVVTRIENSLGATSPISILAGDGRGGFRDDTSQLFDGPVPRTVFARRTVFADFNGDNRSDILIADTGTDSAPFPGAPNTLILSAAAGKLADASANLPRQADFTHSVAVGDVDRNATIDIYAGNLDEGWAGGTTVAPEILLNDGTGHFHLSSGALPSELATGAHYDGSTLTDVDGDHTPDLVLAGSPGAANRVLLNDGAGHFHDLPGALPDKPWGVDSEGLDVASTDLNSDGHADLLIAYTKNNPFYKGRWVQVLVNKGDGTFRDETATRLPQADNFDAWPYKIELDDLNGDGNTDIAVSSFPGAAVPSFYLNRGDGSFIPLPTNSFASPPPAMFTLLDANNDKLVDVLGAMPAVGGSAERHQLLEQLPPLPDRVEGLASSRGLYRGRVHVSWTPVPNASRYEIWRRTNTGRSRIGSTMATAFDDRKAHPGVRYRYSVRAVNAAGAGPFSLAATGYRHP